jgi:hypothetical protein
VATIALTCHKLSLDLICRREGVHIGGVMSHEVPFALATSHVHANYVFLPWDSIAQLILLS